MSSRFNAGAQISSIILLIFGLVVGGLLLQDNKVQTQKNAETVQLLDAKISKRVDDLDLRVSKFIEKWQARLNVSNTVNNATLTRQAQILEKQLTNEQHILGNLTAHRHVANYTRDQILSLQNTTIQNQKLLLEQEKQLLDLQNKTDTLTGSTYAKLADIRVRNIIGNISAEHEQIEHQHDEIIKYLGNLTNSTR